MNAKLQPGQHYKESTLEGESTICSEVSRDASLCNEPNELNEGDGHIRCREVGAGEGRAGRGILSPGPPAGPQTYRADRASKGWWVLSVCTMEGSGGREDSVLMDTPWAEMLKPPGTILALPPVRTE